MAIFSYVKLPEGTLFLNRLSLGWIHMGYQRTLLAPKCQYSVGPLEIGVGFCFPTGWCTWAGKFKRQIRLGHAIFVGNSAISHPSDVHNTKKWLISPLYIISHDTYTYMYIYITHQPPLPSFGEVGIFDIQLSSLHNPQRRPFILNGWERIVIFPN